MVNEFILPVGQLIVMTVTVEEMKKIEEWAAGLGFNTTLMMENAGRAVYEAISERFDSRAGVSVCVLCGTGNNGGDALAAARHLALNGYNVKVYLVGGQVKGNDPALMLRLLEHLIMPEARSPTPEELAQCDVIVDGIFGTGIKGEVKEPFAGAIRAINSSKAFVVAVDVPSGVDPDTGEAAGLAVTADLTVTIHDAKPGLLKAKQYVGTLLIKEIGIPLLPGDLPRT